MTFEELQPGDFQPTTVDGGLPKLVRIWEHLRGLNWGGYGGAVLVDVKGATSKGKGGVTSCSPFTGTCIYMALDPRPFDAAQPWSMPEPYEPLFDGGKPLDVNFYRLHNSFGLSTYATLKGNKLGSWKADFKQRFVDRLPQLAGDFDAFNFINHSAGSLIALNLGERVEPKKMRRGDLVGIDWHNGHGHATFCWNVHLNGNGDVDCFQFISSNGTSAGGGAGITVFRYPDVDPAYLEKSDGKYKKRKEMFSGIIGDPKAYPDYIQKPYWWFGLPGVKKGDIDPGSFGVPAKSVQISYADSMDVAVHEVHVARLHGVTPPEPYLRADGGKTPEPAPPASAPPLTTAKAKKVDTAAASAAKAPVEKAPAGAAHPVQEALEGQLQTLWQARWISKSPGDPGSVNDAESQAAIRDFQEKFMKAEAPKPGVPDPKTRARIARAAASAQAMPMVNAALQLAHDRGLIDVAPGPIPAQLDDATRAAVKAFQRKKGLDPDGLPGHDTQQALSAYLKEESKAKPQPSAAAKPAASELAASILFFYFTRNHGPPGGRATISVIATPACNGKTYAVDLLDGGKTVAHGQVSIASGMGSVELAVPEKAPPGSTLLAKLSGGGLTAQTFSPFHVIHDDDAYVAGARKAHADYVTLLNRATQWSQDQASFIYIAQWCEGMLKEEKFKKLIDEVKLTRFKDEMLSAGRENVQRLNAAAEGLTSILDDPYLQTLIQKLGYRGGCELAVLVQGLSESLAGRRWIDREIAKEEHGFLNTVRKLDTVEGAHKLKEKFETEAKLFELVEPWFDTLAEFVPSLTRVYQEGTADEVATLIAGHLGIHDLQLAMDDLVTIESGVTHAPVYSGKVRVLKVASLLAPEVAEAVKNRIKTGLEGLGKVVTLVNLAAKLNQLYRDPKARTWLEAGGAMVSVLGGLVKASEAEVVRDLVRAGRQLDAEGLPAAARTVVAGFTEEAGEGVLKTLGETLAKKVEAFSVLATAIDIVTSLMEAGEAHDKGDTVAYPGKTTAAVGGLLFITGAAFSATIVGAPLGAVFMVLGTLVGLVGSLIALFGAQSELEVWANHCQFGRLLGQGEAYRDWKEHPEKQIEELVTLLYTVQMRSTLEDHRLVIEIAPTMLTQASNVTVQVLLKGARSGGNETWLEGAISRLAFDGQLGEQVAGVEIEYEEMYEVPPFFEQAPPPRVKLYKVSLNLLPTADEAWGASTVAWKSAQITLAIEPDGTAGNHLDRQGEILIGTPAWMPVEATAPRSR